MTDGPTVRDRLYHIRQSINTFERFYNTHKQISDEDFGVVPLKDAKKELETLQNRVKTLNNAIDEAITEHEETHPYPDQ